MCKFISTKAKVAWTCALVGAALLWLPVGNFLTRFGYDFSFILVPTKSIDEVVIVEMDERSYQDLGQQWGQRWDRRLHARLLKRIAADQGKLTVFDVIFFDASEAEADREFAEAIRANGKVVLAASLESINGQGVVGTKVQPPWQLLATNSTGWGIADVALDADRTVRRLFSGTANHASLPWIAASILGAPITQQPDRRLQERWINYYGPPQTISSISYSDAMEAPAGYFKDRVVFIGGRPKTRFVGDEVDEFSTPFTRWDGSSSGGVEIVATCTLNLVREDWLVRFPFWLESLLVLAVGAALGLGVWSLGPLKAFLVGIGVVLITLILAAIIVSVWHAWFAWSVIALVQVPMACFIAVLAQKSQPTKKTEIEQTAQTNGKAAPELSDAMPISSVTASNAVAAGAVVADHKLLRLIGEGGYGQVWLCQNAVGIYRAAKIVFREKFEDTGPYHREFRGVQNFMRLNHSHLLRVLHIGPNAPEELFYYIMELGDDEEPGKSIDPGKYVARTLASDLKRLGRLPVEECISLGLAIAKGLEYLHSQSLIHRDIKPSNIIYVDGLAKLADVGLVADPETTDLSLVGTRGYMDPYFPSSVGSDIYGLGKVLYVAVTGLNPSQFPEMPSEKHLPLEQPELNSLSAILTKACSASAAERYPSITAMIADLEAIRTATVRIGNHKNPGD
jgi:CHASE2 domain-containing sensor protein